MADFLPWGSLGLALVNSLATFVLWLRRPGEDASRLVRELENSIGGQLAKQSERVVMLEERVKHVPTSEELAQLEGEVRALSANINAVSSQVQTVANVARRIEEFLLNSAKK